MSKAYDRVSWAFFFTVMQKMGFPTRFLTLIRHAVKNCWFMVLVNGEAVRFFKSTQGLRQGDRISPALFILAAEAFSKGLNFLFTAHPNMYYQTQCEIKTSHLSYADDIIIFTNCKEAGLKRLTQFLRSYKNMLEQKINYTKSAFIPAKKTSLIAQRIKAITGFTMKALSITFLGAPLYKGNKRKSLYVDLIDKTRTKIVGWEQCYLSYGGRLQLVKTVLASMPICLLQVLNPPHDWWLPEGILANLVGTQCNLHIPVNWFWLEHEWDIHKLQQVVPQYIINMIMEVPINTYQSDYLHWKLSKHGAFTTKSAWNEIRSQQPVQQFYRSLWFKLLILNISIFAWRLIHNWIPVDQRLK
ncbi:UNVERIFIED_CONTAM: hypothetical protein Sradi_2380900 [Sesamum radiatum]|uniref:Reverse transcriptase domain-containing protein n=1 Tax=Sesamum radiatum TaxID=300843 RepID=A0AAW2T9G3_SESRA